MDDFNTGYLLIIPAIAFIVSGIQQLRGKDKNNIGWFVIILGIGLTVSWLFVFHW